MKLGREENFFKRTQKVLTVKEKTNKLDYTKIMDFYSSKDTTERNKAKVGSKKLFAVQIV